MSYEVIARRWRPQDFTGLVGQEHVRQTLVNALRNDRLHHALLLTGPRGTGKTSTARILAKALRCPNAVDFVPCNACPECEEISTGRSVNVIEIDGASNNGVDAIRELRETVGYLPSSGKYKMYIIDEVHMLSTSAFNALLKTLEEPPGHVYFCMATTEVQKIPNTILSRVQRFDFRRIPTRVISAHLKTICIKDQVAFDEEALWIIARQGDGSMRDAQSLLDQVINFTGGQLKKELVIGTLGLTDRGLLNDALGSILGGQTSSTFNALARLHQSGGDPKLFLLDLLEQIRNALLIKLEPDPQRQTQLVDLPDSEREVLQTLGAALAPEDFHLFFDMGLKGAQDMARASDPLLVLEMVLLRMSSALRYLSSSPSVSVEPTLAPVPPTAPPRAPGPASSLSAPAPTPVATKSAATPPTTENRFKDLVEKIKEVNGLVGAQLENCFVLKLEGIEVELGVSVRHKFLFDKMNTPEFKKKILNYMNSFWGAGHALNFVLTEPGVDVISPKALNEKRREDQAQAVRRAVENHPLVQSTQNVFKTEIKSIKEIKE